MPRLMHVLILLGVQNISISFTKKNLFDFNNLVYYYYSSIYFNKVFKINNSIL